MVGAQPLIRALSLLLALPLAAGAAPDGPLLDQWSEELAGGRKVGWGRLTLTATAAGGYRVVRRAWQPIGPEAQVTSTLDVETDGAGRIVRYRLVSKQPLGTTTREATRAGESLRWTVTVRQQPTLRGTVSVPVHDPDVLAYLHATGARAPGTHRVHVLHLPGGAPALAYRVVKTKRGIRWEDEDRAWYDARGRFLGGEDPRRAGARTRPVEGEAQARDLTRGADPDAPTTLVEGALTLRRPQALGWSLQRTPRPGRDVLGLTHAQEALLLAIPVPTPLPKEPKPRRAAAARLLAQLNKTKDWFRLEAGAAGTFAGRPAVALKVGGAVGGIPSAGRGWLVAGFAPKRSWLVIGAAPVDVAASPTGQALLKTALQAVRLSAPRRQRVQVPGLLSYTVPADWSPLPGRRGSSARSDRAGQLHLGRIAYAAEEGPEGHQREALARLKQLIPDAKVTKQGPAKLNGVAGHRMELVGHVRRAGKPAPARVVAWLIPRGDGTAVLVTAIGMAINDFDLTELDAVLESLRWTEAG